MLVLLSGEEDRDIHDGDYVVLFEEEREERSFYTERKVGGEKRTRTRTRGEKKRVLLAIHTLFLVGPTVKPI